MATDLIREEFQELTVVRQTNSTIGLVFGSQTEADRAYFLIKNSVDLGFPIQIRTNQTE